MPPCGTATKKPSSTKINRIATKMPPVASAVRPFWSTRIRQASWSGISGDFEWVDAPVQTAHPNPLPAAAGRGRDPREAWEGEGQARREPTSPEISLASLSGGGGEETSAVA